MKLLLATLLLLPVTALADTQGAGAPAPPKNAPVDKKAPSQEPTKPAPPGPVDKAPAEKAPSKDKPVDKPGGGSGSDAAPAHKPIKSPPRHA